MTRGETAEPVSRDRILRRERGQHGNTTILSEYLFFPCSAGHEQDWQPLPDRVVDPCPAIFIVVILYIRDHSYSM